jgi:energy-coupling factor transporter ATP-binding protein EcfA2
VKPVRSENRSAPVTVRTIGRFAANPFTTKRTCPSNLPHLAAPVHPDGDSISDWVRRWEKTGFFGQVIGPHGSGKTNLSLAIAGFVQGRFSSPIRATIRTHRFFGTPPIEVANGFAATRMESGPRRLFIIDGIERITRLNRWLMLTHLRREQAGVLITSHRRLHGIATICETTPGIDVLHRLVSYLLRKHELPRSYRRKFENGWAVWAYQKSQGNLREALMLLYDRFEDVRFKIEMDSKSDFDERVGRSRCECGD